MASEYVTKDGDTADYIAWKFYGTAEAAAVHQLVEANPGLADRGPELPAGLVLVLPDLPAPATTQGVRLWD